MSEFRKNAPSAEAVFLRTYSRRKPSGERENFAEAMLRTVADIGRIGKLDKDEQKLITGQALNQHTFPSGRAFWVAGTEWGKQQKNFSGYYNCTSTHIFDQYAFGLLLDLAMQGSGTGAVLEQSVISSLPIVSQKLKIIEVIPLGEVGGCDDTDLQFSDKEDRCTLIVGDSRQGWVDAYQGLINAAFYSGEESFPNNTINIVLDLSNVRPSGEKLKGFGGTANPIKLEESFVKICKLLSGAYGRQLTSVEACLLIDEGAAAVVAGNIRRSAGMRQFSESDEDAATAKLGLYTQDEEGNWKVDPAKEALRMANHTICYHTKPSYEEVEKSVRMQFESGEGAIQFVPEAIARANADLLVEPEAKKQFIKIYTETGRWAAKAHLADLAQAKTGIALSKREIDHRMDRYGLNPCGEIIGRDFHCNLAEVHLNTLDPNNPLAQERAFFAGALQVASLLQHEFAHERYQYSREIDPIVGVSFTGLFDFFVHAFGSGWLKWMMEGRPKNSDGNMFEWQEANYLKRWRAAAREGVRVYCEKHDIRCPNRITTVQPAGTKSLLTGASSGWHAPKAQRFVRRITFGVKDPLVPALMEQGFSVVPAQSARDEEGNLLNDITDPRVQEVLVEIPTEVSWANLDGCDQFDLSKLPIEAQYGLYKQVQEHYTDHNTSATLELSQEEVPKLAKLIYDDIQADKGYISAALLARFDVSGGTFPRLPFEPIDKETYDKMQLPIDVLKQVDDRTLSDFLKKYDNQEFELKGSAGCDSDKCLFEESK
jgi:ribonucleotide reductase class II